MKFIYTITTAVIVFLPSVTHAGSFLRVCTATGNCGICDIVSQAILLGKWLITGASGLALLVIVGASFMLVSSAGNPEKIGAAKKQITGALLGMVITLVAFQLVVMIIGILVTPDSLTSFEATTDQAEIDKAGEQASLSRFLGGAPWWTICSESDLRAKGSKKSVASETADCKYWGDGTACSENLEKICYQGKCEDDFTYKDKKVSNACEFLIVFDKTYEDYECVTQDDDPKTQECDATQAIEEGLCPDKKLCCIKK